MLHRNRSDSYRDRLQLPRWLLCDAESAPRRDAQSTECATARATTGLPSDAQVGLPDTFPDTCMTVHSHDTALPLTSALS